MAAIAGIVFDKDGCLFDFNATWGAWSADFIRGEAAGDEDLMARLAQVLRFDLTSHIFHPDSPVISGTPDGIVDLVRPILGESDPAALLQRINDKASKAPQVEATPLVPFMTDLRARGIKLGVATNDAEAPAHAHLGTAGILEMFEFVAGYDSGFGGKPAPGQLLAFCEQTGLRPDQCIMVGDSLHDLHAGQAAGMLSIGVLTGLATLDDLAPHAQAVLPSIADIPAWLDARA